MEQLTKVGNVELCYETFGDAADPCVLLIMGLGTQMLGWPVEFCEQLAAEGRHVVRFDNRDVGRSTHLRDHRPPTPWQLLRRDPAAAAYSLEDMADDAAGLLDALGVAKAHVVGVSMGGMIAQVVAIRHPDRVLSLASIMSTTGHRLKGQPALKVYPTFLAKPPRNKDEAVERIIKLFRIIGSPGFDRDEADLREITGQSFDRAEGDTSGTGRQLAAILAAKNRAPHLGRISVPTVVIHGTQDRMVRISGGRATAAAIPGAKLVTIEGMGHDLPRGAWPRILGALGENFARAGQTAVAA